jgi:hypothetical protein
MLHRSGSFLRPEHRERHELIGGANRSRCWPRNRRLRGCFWYTPPYIAGGVPCLTTKVRIEVWCDWNPAESDLDDITQAMGVGEAICTMREVVAVVNRPQDIEDEEAMSFFGGSEGDVDESQG